VRTPLVLATGNAGKVREFARLLGDRFSRYLTLGEVGLEPPEETGTTYAANARLKALACFRATGKPSLADDSGLEVEALGGAPGLHSARYAEDPERRIDKLLEALDAKRARSPAKRRARFVCVLAYAFRAGAGGVKTFRGVCDGEILRERRGAGGFGYDPIFLVPRLGRTMAELSGEEKDRSSHRGRALRAFVRWVDEGANP
jgi:XTP/dITP diphosphohydrolase